MAKKAGSFKPGQPVKLIKSNIDMISEPGAYPDTELTGFRLWVGRSGVKSYQMVGKVAGSPKAVFITLGKHGDPWTPDSARREAERLRLLMRQGVNPSQQAKERRTQEEAARQAQEAQQKVKELTLAIAFKEFLTTKKQKDSTAQVYQWVVGKHFKDWLNKPLVDITQDDVLKQYDKIAEESESSAAHAMRILRAIFHTAQVAHGEQFHDLTRLNPVKMLSHGRKGWNSVDPKDDFIPDEDLPAFYDAVSKLQSETARDYLMVCILTGLRKNEACTLTWSTDSVDIHKKTITIQSEQAKNNQRHMLAMSDYLYDLFLRRWHSRENIYVFPGRSAAGNFSDPEKPIRKVIENAKIQPFSSHSLRRTFATCADALGYSLQEVQRLLNHKPGTVTQKHYIQNLVERTREPMQRINDRLLELMGAKEPEQLDSEAANVVPFSKAQ